MFQHMAKFYNYKPFIVTAAIHQGFDSERWLAPNPSC